MITLVSEPQSRAHMQQDQLQKGMEITYHVSMALLVLVMASLTPGDKYNYPIVQNRAGSWDLAVPVI